jgi:hypothetical protein
MLHTKSLFWFLPAIAGLAITLAPSASQAANFVPLPTTFSDTDFNNAKTTPYGPLTQGWQEDWVSEVRGGNNATNGTYELSVNNWTTNAGANVTYPTTAQNVFTSGQAVDFSISYDGTNATFIWGTNLTPPKTLTASNLTEASRFPNGLDSIFIRLRSNANSSFGLSNLVVDGNAYGGSLLANSSDNFDYLLITGITNNFTLTGKATLSWTGAIPSNSNLDMTVKAGYGAAGAAVPEPLTILGAGVAAGFGTFFKKRVNQNKTKD